MEKPKVLVADKSLFIRTMLKGQLESMGYDVTAVTYNVQETMSKSQETQPDIALIDVAIAETDDFAVIRTTRERNSLLDIIVMIPEMPSFTEKVVDAVRAGANGYIKKPVSPKDLALIISRVSRKKFEDNVVELYRQLGFNVKQNVMLAGFMLDIYVEHITDSGKKLRQVIECKDYYKLINKDVVVDFLRTVSTLVKAGLVDEGVLVSRAGFTSSAKALDKTARIKLITIKDLPKEVGASTIFSQLGAPPIQQTKPNYLSVKNGASERHERVFVAMPFTEELDDLYFLGIAPAADENGLACARVDKMEFVGDVIDKIHGSIDEARLLIAEVTSPNPNVYYEIGYAQGARVPIIPITKNPELSSFDIRGQNHIVYKNIRDLKRALSDRLKEFLKER